jgi:hypothetical protein
MAISRENLAREFTSIVNQYYPHAGEVLNQCYVKIIECDLKRLRKRIYYIVIYYPQRVANEVLMQQDAFKEIAENMGLVEVVYINATRLVRDPMSQFKQEDARLWLELHWIATHGK